MAEEEKDIERELRIRTMVTALQRATENQTVGDAQAALGNMVALLCLSAAPQDPDRLFLETQAALSEVYLAIRAHVRSGKEPQVIPGALN